ncbi:GNAT family N-acetyltransferase [Erythrobacter sp. WH158]|uniref:GNAT family N-acetyltransferase n=1 Tax=Erythrobacter crassostreae TaxID=2828328 RepID=A0A9X1JKW2_9SPHN|nr:GNAT family N-acetyltransferase [Erythrobacter crassostrea]
MRLLDIDQVSNPQFIADWERLAAQASEPNPFFEPWFLLPSLSAFAGQNSSIAVIAHYTRDTLTGVLPINRSIRYYGYPVPHIACWLHDNAFYGAPLVASGCEHAFWEATLEHMDKSAGRALFLHLPLLEQGGVLDRALEAVLAGSERFNAVVLRRERAMLASDLSCEDYLANALSKKHRKELRRQRRRLADEGDLTVERLSDETDLARWTDQFLALEAAGWKGAAGSALSDDSATGDFFKCALQGAAQAGKLERLTLHLDRSPVAMLASFVTAPGAYSFKTAFNERYAANSPGLQLQIDNLSSLDHPKIKWTDSCAAEGHPMIDRLWTERRQLVSRNIAIGGPLRRAAFRQMMAFETRRKPSS